MRLLARFGLVAVGLLLVGCTAAAPPSPAPQPTTAPSPQAQTQPQAAVAPTGEPAQPAQPAAQPSPQAQPQGQAAASPTGASWDQVVAAANQEGKVVVIGPVGDPVSTAMTQGFEQQYPGIQVDFTGTSGSQAAEKVLTPLGAGQHLTDVVITGTVTILGSLRPANALEPLQPYLVGPDDQDPSKWLNGTFHYSDKTATYNLLYASYVVPPWMFNPTLASAADFTSNRSLLDPRWKGKIVMMDPRLAGDALSVVTYWYETPSLGKDFITQFFTSQDITMVSDDRQALDGVAQGQYAIEIGASDVLASSYLQRGLPLQRVDGAALAEGPYTSPGNGTLAVVSDPPHPNATKVYLNWLLSQAGQLAVSHATGVASLRVDVPHDFIADSMVPKPGVTYQDQGNEDLALSRQEIVDFETPLLPQ